MKECNCTEARYGQKHAESCPKFGQPVTWKDKIAADTRSVQNNPRYIGNL